jgi:hypothetical protein
VACKLSRNSEAWIGIRQAIKPTENAAYKSITRTRKNPAVSNSIGTHRAPDIATTTTGKVNARNRQSRVKRRAVSRATACRSSGVASSR